MMNQQPDKFFRDKLLDYQQEAPANAWNRVSQNVNKRRRNVWLRYAASILVVAASGVAIYPLLTEKPSETLAENSPVPKQNNEIPPDTTTLEENKSAVKSNDGYQKEVAPTPSRATDLAKTPTGKKYSAPPTKEAEGLEKIVTKVETTDLATARLSEELVITEQELAEVKSYKQPEPETGPARNVRPKNVTIVFTAEEVNNKYLQKNKEAEATTDAKGSSGLRKLLDKANDLTTNQDLLGELRQKKNEILAMNFRSEKQRSEND